jgi:PPK2 family polyphosphate:nucleotide phosphotransferase
MTSRLDRHKLTLSSLPLSEAAALDQYQFRYWSALRFWGLCGRTAMARGTSQEIEAKTNITSNDFRVRPGKKVNLSKWPTIGKPVYKSKRDYKKLLQEHVSQLSSLQRLHYAYNRYSLLLIFQAMDAAGKDGAIAHVMSGVNPQGCKVYSFKHPSEAELEHDFLWRTTQALPERGQIGIFNRSYYEEVLIVRVHPEILDSEGLPLSELDERTVWQGRFRSIVDLENHLHRNGTLIVKFFLHVSAEEQRKRFLQRIDEPDKNWKFSLADVEERAFWKQYMKAYEECLSATMRYPALNAQRRMELSQIRDQLAKEHDRSLA